MNLPTQLDSADVIRLTKNDSTRKLSSVNFEEENDVINEVPVTALTIARYKDDNRYYLFLCDKNWEVLNDLLLDSVDEALEFAKRNFDVNEYDWITLNL